MDLLALRRVLIIASHYPPMRGSSGLQRTLKFSRYLIENGWHPTVLTVHQRAHPRLGYDQMAEIPKEVEVIRAFALDSGRHLSILGRFPRVIALPDRWISWWLGAVPSAMSALRNNRYDLIFSTHPIPTAHLVARSVSRKSGIPWVAEFRDPMTEDNFPADRTTRRVNRWLEEQTVTRATRVIFTTPGCRERYRERYASLPPERWVVIPNGYDEENFASAETSLSSKNADKRSRLYLVHSGLLYPEERDPSAFFEAISQLKKAGLITPKVVRIVLRATGYDSLYQSILDRLNIADVVELAPAVDYRSALEEMLTADGLLLFQAENCDAQIPAKLYEYFRARRPIFAMTSPTGDTAKTLLESGIDSVVPLDSKREIEKGLLAFVDAIKHKLGKVPSDATVLKYARRNQAVDLAKVFDAVAASG